MNTIQNFQSNYLSKLREYGVDTDKFHEIQGIIKYLSSICINIKDKNTKDFSKLREIIKKQEMIETFKKLGKYKNIDDILKVIKMSLI